MSETINLNATISVPNGPKVSVTRSLTVDAYDKFDIDVPDGTSGMEVQLQVGGSEEISFLLVAANPYHEDLSYKVNSGTTVRKLDQPHLLTGVGAVSMLDQSPQKLIFGNASGQNARIQILIGRNVTPP